jgi:Uma2 family endonuclease
MSSVLILDPYLARDFVAAREASGSDRFDEVWEGRVVVPPMPNDEHQEIQFNLLMPLGTVVAEPNEGKVRAGVNVTDRHPNWTENYRGPDVVVYLNSNPAINHGSHCQGGPDFLVEIISPGEKPYDKFDFYEKVNTREVMIITRDPWAVELHELRGGKLVLVGRPDLFNSTVLTSSVLPLTYRLVTGQSRPRIEVVHPPTGRRWEA